MKQFLLPTLTSDPTEDFISTVGYAVALTGMVVALSSLVVGLDSESVFSEVLFVSLVGWLFGFYLWIPLLTMLSLVVSFTKGTAQWGERGSGVLHTWLQITLSAAFFWSVFWLREGSFGSSGGAELVSTITF